MQLEPKDDRKPETADSAEERSIEHRITGILLEEIFGIAERTGATAIFILYDPALSFPSMHCGESPGQRVFYVVKHGVPVPLAMDAAERVEIPNVPLTRMGQIKLAIFLALCRKQIGIGDIVVCLTGPADSRVLDTLFVAWIDHETEMFAYLPGQEQIPERMQPEVISRVVDIATELGLEGREGKPVGALFVIGDSSHVMELSRPLILNPFYGYREEQRNILDPGLEETIKELSSIDGAFVIREDGVVETCGVVLQVAGSPYDLPSGLGSRHHAGAGITAVTESLAIAVSESTGTVTIYRSGQKLADIEKPRRLAQRSRKDSCIPPR